MSNKLSNWIRDAGGREKVAKRLGVTPQGVGLWLRRESTPCAATIFKIFRLSKGAVTFEDILKETKGKRK